MSFNNLSSLFFYAGLLPTVLLAIPKFEENTSVNHQQKDNTLTIHAPDHAIIQYDSFNLAKEEAITFIQPSSSSVVLNRVVKENPSSILGKIEANGKVFLVNPYGIYFGKDCQVNVHSLVASTLDIANDDFKNNSCHFYVSSEKQGSLQNYGSLISKGGNIALISSSIENDGIILAKTKKIVLATGEKIALDFDGDNLISFASEIPSNNDDSIVAVKESQATNILEDLLSIDQENISQVIVKKEDAIYLSPSSYIEGEEVYLAGRDNSHFEINGTIDTSNEQQGGTISLIGDNININDANILSLGEQKGGKIFIGKDEKTPYQAKEVLINEKARLDVSGNNYGDGGSLLIWSDEKTVIEGALYAKGGSEKGNGGWIETSAKKQLFIQTKTIDITTINGQNGMWLLDPTEIIIQANGENTLSQALSTDGPSTCYIDPNVFNAATSDITLRALNETGRITLEENTTLTLPDRCGITFEVDEDYGMIYFKNNSAIDTSGGKVIFTGPVTFEAGNSSITTNRDRRFADIIFRSTIDGSSDTSNININAGTRGYVYFENTVGEKSAIGSLTVAGKKSYLHSNIITKGEINFLSPLLIEEDLQIDTTNNDQFIGANISFKQIDGSHALIVNTGEGTATFDKEVGKYIPVQSLKVSSASTSIGGNISATGSTITFEGPVVLTSGIILTDYGPTGILFLGAITGAQSLTCNAPFGKVYFGGDVGTSGTNLAAISVTGGGIEFASGTSAVTSVDMYSSSTINLYGPVTLKVPTTIAASTLIDIHHTVNGTYNLYLTASTITLGENLGSQDRLNNFRATGNLTSRGITASTIYQTSGNGVFYGNLTSYLYGGINLTGTAFTFWGGVTTYNGGPVTIAHTGNLNTHAGADFHLTGAFTESGGGNVSLQGDIYTVGANINFSSPVILNSSVTCSTGCNIQGDITFNNTIVGAYDLCLLAGAGDINFATTIDIGMLYIPCVHNVTASATITVDGLHQETGTGTANYQAINSNVLYKRVHIESEQINLNGQTITTHNGNAILNALYGSLTTTVNIGSGDIYYGANPSVTITPFSSFHAAYPISSNTPSNITINSTVYYLPGEGPEVIYPPWQYYEVGTYQQQDSIGNVCNVVVTIQPPRIAFPVRLPQYIYGPQQYMEKERAGSEAEAEYLQEQILEEA